MILANWSKRRYLFVRVQFHHVLILHVGIVMSYFSRNKASKES